MVDIGCGTGANLPYLREAVGCAGTVIGVDATPELARRASSRASRWENVHVLIGDATSLPTRDVDAFIASFVVGLLDDPVEAVDEWLRLGHTGTKMALIDGVSTGWCPLDVLFGIFVWIGSPSGTRGVLSRLN
ncbi:MAG: class I SAM-dependent methyltransferase, partial [Halobacteriaceae archaeon]